MTREVSGQTTGIGTRMTDDLNPTKWITSKEAAELSECDPVPSSSGARRKGSR